MQVAMQLRLNRQVATGKIQFPAGHRWHLDISIMPFKSRALLDYKYIEKIVKAALRHNIRQITENHERR